MIQLQMNAQRQAARMPAAKTDLLTELENAR